MPHKIDYKLIIKLNVEDIKNCQKLIFDMFPDVVWGSSRTNEIIDINEMNYGNCDYIMFYIYDNNILAWSNYSKYLIHENMISYKKLIREKKLIKILKNK